MTPVTRRTFVGGAMAAALAVGGAGRAVAASGAASAQAAPPNLAAARAAIQRLSGLDPSRFALSTLVAGAGETDAFQISRVGDQVGIAGSSTVALLSGFNWWLKYVARGHLSANGDQLQLPSTLPTPATPIRMSTELAERYAYNFTFFGYTSPYWQWPEWERELDFLAINGTNRALALIGQEIVWYDTFRDFGMSELEVRQWISMPAHQPWQWYGETTGYDLDASGYSGPVSVEFLHKRRDLGQQIVARMRELGITPVFPAFVGHVPDEVFKSRHPGTHIPAQKDYAGHPRPYWLDTTEALYPEVARRFYEAQRTHFGTTTHFSNDLFHEVGDDLPDYLDGANLGDAAVAVQNALEEASPGAIWLLQGWQSNPRLEILNAVDENRVIVLDLDSDDDRKWEDTEAYWGVPWCWGSIQNFGGRLGMFGNLGEPGQTFPRVRTRPERRRLVGCAWVQEGLHQNPIVPDLLGEMMWRRSAVDLSTWVRDFAVRRYGSDDANAIKAWDILRRTAYSYVSTNHTTGEGPFESAFQAMPDLNLRSVSMFGPDEFRYLPEEFEPALPALLAVAPALRNKPTYKYDVVDVTRQVLANRGRLLLDKIREAYEAKDRTELARHSNRFLTTIDQTERILGTHPQWMLGPWLEQAKTWGTTADEKQLIEWNARSMITIWTEEAFGTLREYANREWHGLLSSYYKPRWQRFLTDLPATMASGKQPEYGDWLARGDAWSQQTELHRTTPAADPYTVAADIAAALAADPL
ncbi:alpha-N-acetylglucosaminidase [Kribbella yunnanensis]